MEQLVSSAESRNCPPTELGSLASEANLISSITPATKATTWWAILEERVTEDTGKGSSLFAVLFNSNQQLWVPQSRLLNGTNLLEQWAEVDLKLTKFDRFLSSFWLGWSQTRPAFLTGPLPRPLKQQKTWKEPCFSFGSVWDCVCFWVWWL